MPTQAPAARELAADWRRGLRRKLIWLLVAKLVGLLLLWALFFSPSHRVTVTEDRAGRQFALPGKLP